MSKKKSTFICQDCGYESKGWLGKCPACNEWNTFVEEILESKSINNKATNQLTPVSINEIVITKEERWSTGIKEMDRVLGGGMVKGSLILVGGDPGIGKSTLILQICESVNVNNNIIYISGEESESQIKLRANRLNISNKNLYMVSETNFRDIENLIYEEKPSLVIIDSIQTMHNKELMSAPGSVGQVRDVTLRLMGLAKGLGITIIIVGHVTKEGAIAGPRVLEHMVDTVLYFEGERHLSYRILRGVKNRFGSTNEIGVFEMKDIGLVEINNPSVMLLSGRPENVSGSVVVSSMEGSRPMLVEVQSLVSPTNFGMPRRMATGVDYNRITLLMAVLEKKVGMQLNNFDAYVNVVGGLKIDEPACDLGFVLAIASSFKNLPISSDTVIIGEVGLTGEVRTVNQIDKRIMEAKRIGFKRCIIPQGNEKSLKLINDLEDIKITMVANVKEALEVVL